MANVVQQNVKIFTTTVVLFFVALILTSYSSQNPAVTSVGMGLASEILAPAQSVTRSVYSGVDQFWSNYIALVSVVGEKERLEERLSTLESEYAKLIEFKHENARLRDLLKIKQSHDLLGVTGNVIAHDPSRWADTITLDVGSQDGVQSGQAVVMGGGVVGQVISSGISTSRVLLLTDPTSGVDAILQETRVRGVVEGKGEFRLFWNYVLNDHEISVGERIVTSGKDGIFPRGLVVGVVSDVVKTKGNLFQKIEVTPSVDFSMLETVMVITGKGEAAHEGE